MFEYPKIETLYDRDPKTFKVDVSKVRCPEFENVRRWLVTEKIDGTNIRIEYKDGKVTFGGRTDNAMIPALLLAHLQETFAADKLANCFPGGDVLLFGEGYGPKINNGGWYRSTPSFRLFDAYIGGWWLEYDSLQEIAESLSIKTVPYGRIIENLPLSLADLDEITGGLSAVAFTEGDPGSRRPEGIVARSTPLMLFRSGQRIMWKLKYKDF